MGSGTSRSTLAVSLGAAALWAVAPPALSAAAPPSPPVVEYTIEAALDPAEKTLEGRETLVWRNPSGDSVPELRFHLYLNAFKNTRSTFMRESGGRVRGDEAGTRPEDWGWIDVDSLEADGVELSRRSRFVQPDGNDPEDQTVLAVPLPSPVPPHGSIRLRIRFRAKLPRIFARTGYVRDYFLVGQWYPKIGVYEPAGLRERRTGGWNCHAFHAFSEFYADFGRFDVSLTVPNRFVVGATGKRVSETRGKATTTYRYVQDGVHDFAWTADPRFRVTEFTFDPARDVPAGWAARAARELGMPEAELALRPVSIRLLLQPGHERARERYVRSTREAISFFGLWYGGYPYETLTVVDPPDDGTGSEGMEYPTLFTGGEAGAGLTRWPFDRVRLVEVVTIHEFGHQYWYGMVGSNEFEEPWLDEGITDDSERRAMSLAYGPRDFAEFTGGVGFDSLSIAHGEYASVPNLDPIRRFAWRYASGPSYGTNVYPKVGLLLAQLRNDLGVEAFARAQRAYFQEWSFRHPGTSDFFRVFERVSGRDLSAYRRFLVEGNARLDWQVVSAKTEESSRDSGVFDRPAGRVTLKDGEPASGKRAGPRPKARGDRGLETFDTTVLFGNTGDWSHGAPARMVFEDGSVVDRVLPAQARWVRYRIRYRARLAWAAVDPERRNPWDVNRLNDSRVVGAGKGEARTLSRRAQLKYAGWAAFAVGLWTQLLWALA